MLSHNVWMPQPGKQLAAITAREVDVLLFGGAKYGGKSDFLLGDFLQDVAEYGKNWHGILIRRSMPELDEIIGRSQELYLQTGASWGEQKKTWTFKEGSTLMFRAIEREADISKFQGWSKTWIGLDEVANWPTDKIFRQFAIANNRWGRAHVPVKRIRMTANPGGIGHHWVKDLLIDPCPTGFKLFQDKTSGKSCMFIPSKITDNRLGLERDPDYIRNLEGLGSPELVKAWLEGDWSVITGAYFPEFSIERHVIKPFEIPKHWFRVFAHDWGSSSPFASIWGAISDGEEGIPKGALVVYREIYGASAPNQGLKMRNEDIADLCLSREAPGEKVSMRVIDPACFAQEGGICIAETYKNRGLNCRPADNKRIPGWAQIRSRLIGQDEKPMIYFFDTCRETIRTLPALQHDERKPEDVNCFIAGTMITTISGEKPIESIEAGELVKTPIGYRKVIWAGLSGHSATQQVRLSNGSSLTGTPDHRVYIKNKGLIPLSELAEGDILQGRNIRLCRIRRSPIRESFILEGLAEGITSLMERIYLRATQHFTGRYTSIILDLFQKGITSITEIMISIIIPQKTYKLSSPVNMPSITIGKGEIYRISSESGGNRHQAGSNSGKTSRKAGLVAKKENLRAAVVQRLLKQDIQHRSIAAQNAKRLPAVSFMKLNALSAVIASSLRKMAGKPLRHAHISVVGSSESKPQQVFNLTVEEAHLFFANNCLVTNTEGDDHLPDALRYMAMSRAYMRPKPDQEKPRYLAEMTLNDLWKDQKPKKKRI